MFLFHEVFQRYVIEKFQNFLCGKYKLTFPRFLLFLAIYLVSFAAVTQGALPFTIQDHFFKRFFLRSNSYKIELIIASLIEMLELTNFAHMGNRILVNRIWVMSKNFVTLTTKRTKIMMS